MNTNSPTNTSSRSLVLLLAALTALGPLSIDMYLPSLPSIGRDLGGDTAMTQATMAIFLAGLAIGQFVYGPLSDRVGRRPLILLGLVTYLLATLVCALAPSVEVMLAGRFLQAVGCSAGVVIANAVVRDLFDSAKTAKVMTSLVMVMGIAPVVAPVLGATILRFGTWRYIFWVLFVFAVLTLMRVFFSLRESRSAETAAHAAKEHPLRSYLLLLRNPRLMGYLLIRALASGMLFAYIAGSPAQFIEDYGLSPQAYSGLLAVNGVGIIAGAVVGSKLVAKWGLDGVLLRYCLAALVLALALFSAAIAGVGGHWPIFVTLFLTLSTFGVISSNAMAGALSTDPLRSGSISALMNSTLFVSGGLAAWITGALYDHTPRPIAGVILGCVSAAAAACWLFVPRNKAAHLAPKRA